jgi:hypothetical protein
LHQSTADIPLVTTKDSLRPQLTLEGVARAYNSVLFLRETATATRAQDFSKISLSVSGVTELSLLHRLLSVLLLVKAIAAVRQAPLTSTRAAGSQGKLGGSFFHVH